MAVLNPRCSAKGFDLGLELGSGWDGPAEKWRGKRVGALGRVRMGEGGVEGVFRGDW